MDGDSQVMIIDVPKDFILKRVVLLGAASKDIGVSDADIVAATKYALTHILSCLSRIGGDHIHLFLMPWIGGCFGCVRNGFRIASSTAERTKKRYLVRTFIS